MNGNRIDKKELRRLRAELTRERAKALKPVERRIAECEGAIVRAEAQLHRLYEEIVSASSDGDGAAIADISIKIHACKREIESCFDRLEPASRELEELRSAFELRMKDLTTRADEGS